MMLLRQLYLSPIKIHADLLKEINKSTKILQKIAKEKKDENEEDGMVELSKNSKNMLN